MRTNDAPCRFFDQLQCEKSALGTIDREAGGNNKGAGFRSRVLTLTPAAHCSLSPCSLLF